MKAIKLASIFAVSAVAAAVSTTTIAAEGVFSGSAGMYLNSYDTSDDKYTSDGELNIIVDTGVVYIDMDMGTVNTDTDGDSEDEGATDNANSFVIDEAYVTQGAVQFGDFNGSLVDAAVMYGGTEGGNDYSSDLGGTLGVRYAVSDDLTVAFEATDGSDDDGFGVSYTADLGVASLTVSGGTQGDDGSAIAAGVEMPLGAATLSGYYQSGTSTADADIGSIGLGVDFAVSDALAVAAAYLEDTEATADTSNIEISVFYTAGDIEYVATYIDYSEDSGSEDYMILGARASF